MSYSQDVENIAQMFEGMDKGVIQAVYNVNNNNLERTIDNLLAMNSAGEQKPATTNTFRNPRPLQNNDNIPVSSSLAEARALERQRRRQAAASSDHKKKAGGHSKTSKWRHPLPPDFLRLPPELIAPGSGSDFQTPSNLRDEELARMLQNEIFREQLREDPLFNRLMAQDKERQQLQAERQRRLENRSGKTSDRNGKQGTQENSDDSNSAAKWFASMSDGLKSFISNRYRQRKRSSSMRRDKKNDGEDTSLLSAAQDEYALSDDESDEENVPLFSDNHDDGLGEGFELGTLNTKRETSGNTL